MESKKKRLYYLDALKSILMCSVVLGHTIQAYYNGDATEVSFWKVTHSLNMPLFLMISGYLSYKNGHQVISMDFVTKMFRGVLLPFIVWTLVGPLLLTGQFDLSQTVHALFYPDAGLWFLYNLFVYRIMFRLTEHFETDKIKQEYLLLAHIAVYAVLMYFFGAFLNFTQICWHLPFFALGYYVRKYSFDDLSRAWDYVFGICYLACITLFVVSPEFMQSVFNSGALKAIYTYFMSLNGAMFCFYLGKRFLDKENKVFDSVSKLTLGMYAFNYSAILYASLLLPSLGSIVFTIGSQWLLALAMTIVMTKVTQKIPYLRLLLLGMK